MKTIKPDSSSLAGVALVALSAWLTAAVPAPDVQPVDDGQVLIQPINHATLALVWKEHAIYVDPLPVVRTLTNLPAPTLVLVTDIHGDHLSLETLKAIVRDQCRIVAPPAVATQLPAALQRQTTVLTNGQSAVVAGLPVEAVAAYNLAPDRQRFHAKGRGNEYVITLGNRRFYLSGDTEDVPEMRALKDIEVAFLCMNLPYTMTVEQAAEAVKAFRPKVVYPYHCRGSDLNRFKELLAGEQGIEVRLRNWYATSGK